MDNDPQTTTDCKEKTEEERQNRRQFLNGFGKWSLAIIAAVAALRDDLRDVQAAVGSRFGTPSTGPGGPRRQIARHGDRVHGDQKYTKYKDNGWHLDSTKHQDFAHIDHRIQ